MSPSDVVRRRRYFTSRFARRAIPSAFGGPRGPLVRIGASSRKLSSRFDSLT